MVLVRCKLWIIRDIPHCVDGVVGVQASCTTTNDRSVAYWGNAEIGIVPFWPVEDLAFQFYLNVDRFQTSRLTIHPSYYIQWLYSNIDITWLLVPPHHSRFYTVPKLWFETADFWPLLPSCCQDNMASTSHGADGKCFDITRESIASRFLIAVGILTSK